MLNIIVKGNLFDSAKRHGYNAHNVRKNKGGFYESYF